MHDVISGCSVLHRHHGRLDVVLPGADHVQSDYRAAPKLAVRQAGRGFRTMVANVAIGNSPGLGLTRGTSFKQAD